MLSRLLRRLLWAGPMASLVSVLTVALLASAWSSPFSALPLFFNAAPRDLRARTSAALEALRRGESREASAELLKLGGAALPQVIPALEGLSPEPRARVVTALHPVAARMGLNRVLSASSVEDEAAAWLRFWDDRSIDFRPLAVRLAVKRYAEHPTASRLRELQILDTAALDELFTVLGRDGAMPSHSIATAVLPAVQRALDLTYERDERSTVEDEIMELRALWFARRLEFISLDAPSRGLAMLSETQYGKWVALSFARNARPEHGGAPVAMTLTKQSLLTGRRVSIGMVSGVLLAMAITALSLWSRTAPAAVRVLIPTVCLLPVGLAMVALRRAEAGHESMAIAVIALSVAFSSARHLRRRVLDELTSPHAITARAFGASRARRVVTALGLPALGLALAQFGTMFPLATSAALMAETIYQLDGLGTLTRTALSTHDIAMMIAIAVLGALLAQMTTLLAEVAQAAGDGRVRDPSLDEGDR